MALSPKQQIQELIGKSSCPLILIPQNPEGDAVGSALALFLILKKINKNPEIVCSTAISEKFLFFPAQESIKHGVSGERLYKLSVDIQDNNIKELSYEQINGVLSIFLTTKSDAITRDSISLEPSKFKYDLVLTVGTPDLESIGRAYFENTELFFQTPIINIDHHPSNEFFGTVNLVEVTFPSTAEIIAELAEDIFPRSLDSQIATLLLAGIISETNNFQNSNISPKTFIIAASLLSAGAAQEEIIKHFYKTKPLPVLKLIGQIISNMRFEPGFSLAWASLSKKDFEKNESSPGDIDMAINELVNNSKDIDSLFISYADSEKIIGNIWMDKKYDLGKLASILNGELKNHKIILFAFDQTIENFEEKTLSSLKTFISNSRK